MQYSAWKRQALQFKSSPCTEMSERITENCLLKARNNIYPVPAWLLHFTPFLSVFLDLSFLGKSFIEPSDIWNRYNLRHVPRGLSSI